MAKNKDGIEAGSTVSWADMVAANKARKAPASAKKNKRDDLIESLQTHGVDDPQGSNKELAAQLEAVTKVNL